MIKLKIYHDGGDGITQASLEYWKEIKDPKWRIHQVTCSKDSGIFNTEIDCFDDDYNLIVVMLSGLSCGYGGTGPHGLETLLKDIGAPPEVSSKAFYNDVVIYNPRW